MRRGFLRCWAGCWAGAGFSWLGWGRVWSGLFGMARGLAGWVGVGIGPVVWAGVGFGWLGWGGLDWVNMGRFLISLTGLRLLYWIWSVR